MAERREVLRSRCSVCGVRRLLSRVGVGVETRWLCRRCLDAEAAGRVLRARIRAMTQQYRMLELEYEDLRLELGILRGGQGGNP